jgi:hypothetical protein
VEFVHVRSSSRRVREATYFRTLFIQSAKGSPPRSGQAAAMTCHVRRPKSRASVSRMPSSIAEPMASMSK